MTHRGGLSLSIIIWRIGGGGPSFLLPWGPKILLAALRPLFMVCPKTSSIRTRASVRQPTYNQWEMNKALLNAFAKRLVQEKLVNVRDNMFYVIQGVIIVTPAKISDELFNIDF